MNSGPEQSAPPFEAPAIDTAYLRELLLRLLAIHSPAGYTDPIVREVCEELEALHIPYEITRRGAIRATLRGRSYSPDRALVTHLDTLGAMVRTCKSNGRLGLVPVGNWSARFAEGARVSLYTDRTVHRGTILPTKASGHIYDEEIDSQPVGWDYVELRVDEHVDNDADLRRLGIQVGDFVGVDARPEALPNGFINARHLDDKAGVAAMLAAAKAISESGHELPVECHLLFTISEEVGSGASAILHGDVAEMVSIDNGTVGPGQNSRETGVTVTMADSTGPFDYHLTHHLLNLCRRNKIKHQRDIFRYYRCDSASALEAGNDIRTALISFGVDASHGYERTHIDALASVASLVVFYAHSNLVYHKQSSMGTIKDFPKTRRTEIGYTHHEPSQSLSQVPPRSATPPPPPDSTPPQKS